MASQMKLRRFTSADILVAHWDNAHLARCGNARGLVVLGPISGSKKRAAQSLLSLPSYQSHSSLIRQARETPHAMPETAKTALTRFIAPLEFPPTTHPEYGILFVLRSEVRSGHSPVTRTAAGRADRIGQMFANWLSRHHVVWQSS